MDRDLRAGHEPDRPVLEPDDRPARGVRPDRLPLGALAAGGAVALAEGRPLGTSPDLGFRVQVSDRDAARLRPSSPVPDRYGRSGFGGAQPAVTACGSTAIQAATAWPSSRSPLP